MLLIAGIPAAQLVRSLALRRLLIFTSGCAFTLIVLNTIGVRLNADLPLVPLTQVGNIGGDAGTVFATFGLLALALALYSTTGRLGLIAIAIPLLGASLLSTQRAAVLGLVAGLVVLVAAAVSSRARRSVTAPELTLALLGLVAVFLLPTYGNSLAQRPAPLPLVAALQEDLDNREKQLSAEDRINQWERVPAIIRERPVLGWGLGVDTPTRIPAYAGSVKSFLVHDIWLDLLLRSGAVGLLLFVAAMLSSHVAAWRQLCVDRRALPTALTVASLAIIAGLLVKGSVERSSRSTASRYCSASRLGSSPPRARERDPGRLVGCRGSPLPESRVPVPALAVVDGSSRRPAVPTSLHEP